MEMTAHDWYWMGFARGALFVIGLALVLYCLVSLLDHPVYSEPAFTMRRPPVDPKDITPEKDADE